MDENIELDEQPNSLDENTATDFSFLDEDDSGRDDVIDSIEVPETAPTETVENTDTVETPAVEVESSPYEFLTMSAMENAKSDETEMSPVSTASSVTEMLTNAAMENAAKGNEYAQSAKTDATKETKAEEESKKGTFSGRLQESIDAIKQSIDMIKEFGKGSSKETKTDTAKETKTDTTLEDYFSTYYDPLLEASQNLIENPTQANLESYNAAKANLESAEAKEAYEKLTANEELYQTYLDYEQNYPGVQDFLEKSKDGTFTKALEDAMAAEKLSKMIPDDKDPEKSTETPAVSDKKADEEKPAEKTPTAAPPALIEDETKTPITETSASTPVDDTETKTPETVPADEPNNESNTPKQDDADADMVGDLEALPSNSTNADVISIISKYDPTLGNFLNAVTQDWTQSNAASGLSYSQRGQALAQQLSDIWTNKSNVLQAVWNTIKAVVKAAGDFKAITKDTQAYRLIKNAQRLTTRAIITAVAAVTGGPLAAVAIWTGSLAKDQLVNLVKNTTLDPEIAKIYESFSDTQDRNEAEDETEGKNYEEGLIKKWDKNDVTIDNKGYNKGLEDKEVSRKELPSDAFVKIIYKKEPWIRKFHV